MNKLYITFAFVSVLMITSCCHESKNELSDCMQEKIATFKASPEAKAIYHINIDGENYYWFNTDATFWDGVEYIYDNDCTQACFFCGECVLPTCTEIFPYDKSKWEIVWKP